MNENPNSRRTLLQATYSPIEVQNPPVKIRAWEKWSYFTTLFSTVKDVPALRLEIQKRLKTTTEELLQKQLIQTLADLDSLKQIIPKVRTPDALSSIFIFKDISPETLIILGEVHLEMEETRVEKLLQAQKRIFEDFSTITSKSEPIRNTTQLSLEGYELVVDSAQKTSDLAIYRKIRTIPLHQIAKKATISSKKKTEGNDDQNRNIPTGETQPLVATDESIVTVRKVSTLPTPKVAAVISLAPRVNEMAQWALDNELYVSEARFLLELSERHEKLDQPLAIKHFLMSNLEDQRNLINGFKERMKVEPIGLLHLEKIIFTPAGIERGELVHSIPLSPGEVVNIAHREWSNTTEEFENLVNDYLEGYSEKGVVDKTELAESSTKQTQHSSGYNTGISISGGYGGVNINTTFNYNIQNSATSSAECSRKRSQEITNKASSRVKREHKVSFRVASASGTEDQRVQTLMNPDQKKSMRVDYFQLIRKWQVDLERYGIRLTYDITIPEPGSDILSRWLEIQDLEDKILQEFNFTLLPTDITRENYQNLASFYQASINEHPPDSEVQYSEHKEDYFEDDDSAKKWRFGALEFNVDPRYSISRVESHNNFSNLNGGAVEWAESNAALIGKSGKVPIIFWFGHVRSYYVLVRIFATLNKEAYNEWQFKIWNNLREAAETNFEVYRQRCRDRLAELKEELEGDDALTLRKMEREEVMKMVVRWLFGPTFRFIPQGLSFNKSGLILYGSDEQVASDSVWERMMAFGEVIKYLHNAIEWENMLYFLYPYFWTHPKEWNTRLYLRHSDPTHQQFLKAGSARVVLTIRPGFEESFLALMELADYSPNALIQYVQQKNLQHPYVTIATEMQNYAKTNYPGIPSANPAKSGVAWRQIHQFSSALEKFYCDCGRYPSSKEGLDILVIDPGNVPGWAGPYILEIPKDPWDTDYVYKSPGDHGFYDIISYGSDGKPGGEEEAADIVSWAEGNLIGSWIEYTPTSALDISINETLPTI